MKKLGQRIIMIDTQYYFFVTVGEESNGGEKQNKVINLSFVLAMYFKIAIQKQFLVSIMH